MWWVKRRPKNLEPSRLEALARSIIDLVVHAGLAPSKGQARKDLKPEAST